MTTVSMQDKKAVLWDYFVDFQQRIAELQHELQQQRDHHRSQQAAVFQDVFEVLDAFAQLEATLSAKQDQMDKTALYLAKNIRSIQKKMLRLLKKNQIQPIEFPEGKARMKYCKVLETQASPDQEEETIISVLKTGYIDRQHAQVLRKAEVVTVHNEPEA